VVDHISDLGESLTSDPFAVEGRRVDQTLICISAVSTCGVERWRGGDFLDLSEGSLIT